MVILHMGGAPDEDRRARLGSDKVRLVLLYGSRERPAVFGKCLKGEGGVSQGEIGPRP